MIFLFGGGNIQRMPLLSSLFPTIPHYLIVQSDCSQSQFGLGLGTIYYSTIVRYYRGKKCEINVLGFIIYDPVYMAICLSKLF